MRVLIAPDSFGGTLSAPQAAAAIAAGWADSAPGDELDIAPLSDGGPGFLDVLHASVGGHVLAATVADPLGRPTPAAVLLVGATGTDGRSGPAGGTAYVESAAAAGLHLVHPAERSPRTASSSGVGELVRVALDAGASRVVVGLGGSGTNDGGAGLLTGLGARLLDSVGGALPPGGEGLLALDRIDLSDLHPRLAEVDLVAATDVDNPLLGLHGASAVFGPQKGAGADDVQVLDRALGSWAAKLAAVLPAAGPAAAAPGAGAAGGLGFALLALGARRESGIEMVLTAARLPERIAAARLVITGEGSFDWQSLRGKAAAGVARAAGQEAVPCIVLAGQVSVGRRELAAAGVEEAYSLAEAAGSVAAAQEHAYEELRALAGRVARTWSRAG